MVDYSINASPKNACNALCINRQYTAVLMKDAGKTEWMIRQVIFPDQDPDTHKMIQFRPNVQDYFSHLSVYYIPIHKILSDEKSIKKYTTRKNLDGTTYEIEFDYTVPDVPPHQVARVTGTIITDSRFSGVIKSAKYQVEAKFGKGITDYTCQVHPDSDGHPVLISTTTSGSFTNPSGKEIQSGVGSVEFEDLGVTAIKDEDFRLSAFGLPEPIGITWEEPKKPTSPSTPTYVWLLCGAGGFAVLAMMLAYFRRRKLSKRSVTSDGPRVQT